MKIRPTVAVLALTCTFPTLSHASPDMECGGSSQVEIGNCLASVEKAVDGVIEATYGFAKASAQELDQTTGREVSVEALAAGQAAWSAYRDAHCEFVGSTYGGGSGTGIAIRSCRIELGRNRARELMSYSR